MENNEKLAMAMRTKRLQSGQTQAEAASHLGIPRPAYACFEQGKTVPTVFELHSLAALFRCTMDSFF